MTLFDETKQDKKLEEMREREAEDLAQLLSSRYSLPYIDLTKVSINSDALKLVPEELARRAGIALFHVKGKFVDAAVITPRNEELNSIFADLRDKHYQVALFIASEASLGRAWDRYKELSSATKTQAGLIDISAEELSNFLAAIKNLEDLKREVTTTIESSKSHGISKLLELILAGAVATDSSDIHLEPEETEARLRFRLDGVLQDIGILKKEAYNLLLSRIKLISSLKLNIKGAAQDGRFTIRVGENDVEVRTSVTPGSYGEGVVLRVLDPKAIAISFEELGIATRLRTLVDIEIKKPNGMVLVTGPTGSGKTTTLYAFLKKINLPGSKIITIEDPIEYHLKGISQTQVSDEKGYTFVEGLRAALRQDPDILMIGEIRDNETAKVAVDSSLTGHLVFSTLHTNNAGGAIPRLVDLGANPKVLSSALHLALAQRLVRKLCKVCKQQAVPTDTERKTIDQILATVRDKEPESIPGEIVLWKAVGCEACNGTGFKGRLGVFEGVKMTEAIETVITTSVSERDIMRAAAPQKMLTMAEDGIIKVLTGVTTLDELDRVVDLEIAS